MNEGLAFETYHAHLDKLFLKAWLAMLENLCRIWGHSFELLGRIVEMFPNKSQTGVQLGWLLCLVMSPDAYWLDWDDRLAKTETLWTALTWRLSTVSCVLGRFSEQVLTDES